MGKFSFLFLPLLGYFISLSVGSKMACGRLVPGYSTGQVFKGDGTATGNCRDERGLTCSNSQLNGDTLLTCDGDPREFADCCRRNGLLGYNTEPKGQRMVAQGTGGYYIACGDLDDKGNFVPNAVLTQTCGEKREKSCSIFQETKSYSSLSCFLNGLKSINKFGRCCSKSHQGFYVHFA